MRACVYVHALMYVRVRACRGACWYETNGDRGCNAAHNAYSTTIYDAQRQGFVTVAPSWTRGLAIHPVGASLHRRLRSHCPQRTDSRRVCVWG